jgi:hypothetical protein
VDQRESNSTMNANGRGNGIENNNSKEGQPLQLGAVANSTQENRTAESANMSAINSSSAQQNINSQINPTFITPASLYASQSQFAPTNSTTPAQPQNTQPQPVRYPSPNFPSDPFCLQRNPSYSLQLPIGSSNPRCLSCYTSFYYNPQSELCLAKNPRCKESNPSNRCLSCYLGYALADGDCLINNGSIPLLVGSALNSASSNQVLDVNCA